MMKNLIQLQQAAQQIRDAYQTGSVTPKMVGSLASDTLTYISMLEQNLQALGIRKTYATEADMNADTAPMGDNGMPIRFGQLVMVTATGKIYAYQAPGWKPVSDAALPVSIGNVVGKRGDRLGNVLGDIGVADPSVEGFTLNDYTTSGTYRIMGDRTNGNDGMPIDNEGGGHRVDAVLTVLDASISSSEACVTQMLVLSNRVAGDGNMYIRTAKGTMSEIQSGANWETWQKMVGQWEKGMVADATEIDTWTESGMYSAMMTAQSSTRGITLNPGDTLFVITINGYDSERLSSTITAQCTQFLYRLPAYYGGVNTGVAKAEQYVGTGLWTGSRYSWGDWKRLADADDVAQLSKGINTNTKEIEDLQNADKVMADALKEKAPKVGYAPDLKVNFAKELTGRGEATPQVIGKIRPTGEISIGDGNATIEKVKGKSVVWNQLIHSWKVTSGGVNISYDGDKATMNGTATLGYIWFCTSKILVAGHKGLLIVNVIKSTGIFEGLRIGFTNKANISSIIRGGRANIFYTCDSTFPNFLAVGIHSISTETHLQDEVLSANNYDLTQMFGAGNEPTTIEEFEARRPLGVSGDYNEGEIISYDGANELQSIGFNAYNGTYAKVIGGQKYHALGNITSIGFASEMNGETTAITLDSDGMFTPTEDGYVYAECSDICIHLAHTYTPEHTTKYEADTLQLPDVKSIKDKDGNPLFPYGLLSAGSAHDEITATKAVKRIVAITFTGEEKWNLQSINSNGIANFSFSLEYRATTNVLCDRFLYNNAIIANTTNEGFIIATGKTLYIRIKASTADTVAKFKEWLKNNHTTLCYELAYPIEVDLEEPLNLTYEAWDFGTEELHTEAKTTPLNADISYQFNAVDRIRENTTKASNLEARVLQLEAMLTQMAQVNESNEA